MLTSTDGVDGAASSSFRTGTVVSLSSFVDERVRAVSLYRRTEIALLPSDASGGEPLPSEGDPPFLRPKILCVVSPALLVPRRAAARRN